MKSLVIWVIQVLWQSTKWHCPRCIGRDSVIFLLLLKQIQLLLGYKGLQRVLMWYASHTPETDEVSFVLWSMVSQNLRPLGAARTMWVYFTVCQQSTLGRVKNQGVSCIALLCYPSIRLFGRQSIHPSIHPFTCPSIYSSIHQSIHLCLHFRYVGLTWTLAHNLGRNLFFFIWKTISLDFAAFLKLPPDSCLWASSYLYS